MRQRWVRGLWPIVVAGLLTACRQGVGPIRTDIDQGKYFEAAQRAIHVLKTATKKEKRKAIDRLFETKGRLVMDQLAYRGLVLAQQPSSDAGIRYYQALIPVLETMRSLAVPVPGLARRIAELTQHENATIHAYTAYHIAHAKQALSDKKPRQALQNLTAVKAYSDQLPAYRSLHHAAMAMAHRTVQLGTISEPTLAAPFELKGLDGSEIFLVSLFNQLRTQPHVSVLLPSRQSPRPSDYTISGYMSGDVTERPSETVTRREFIRAEYESKGVRKQSSFATTYEVVKRRLMVRLEVDVTLSRTTTKEAVGRISFTKTVDAYQTYRSSLYTPSLPKNAKIVQYPDDYYGLSRRVRPFDTTTVIRKAINQASEEASRQIMVYLKGKS